MIFDYVFYETDESFDYPTGYGYATEMRIAGHGFTVELSKDDKILSFKGFGDFAYEIEKLNGNLYKFMKFVQSQVAEYNEPELLEELIVFIKDTIREKELKERKTA